MKKRILCLALAVILALSLAVPALAAGKKYTFNLSEIPQAQWDSARKEILIHVTQGGETKDVKIPADAEGMGHASATDLPVYEDGVKTSRTMSVTVVPTRLLSEALGINISWNGPEQAVEFDTYKGHIKIPMGATSITMPDGTTWKEETYTYPDGSPIQLAMMRVQEGRTYLPIRAFASIAFETSRWDWHNPAILEGWVTMPKTSTRPGWTAEQEERAGYLWENGEMRNLLYLPNTIKALKETGVGAGGTNPRRLSVSDRATGQEFYVEMRSDAICFTGLDAVLNRGDSGSNLIKVMTAMIRDIVADPQDAQAICTMIEGVEKWQKAANKAAAAGDEKAMYNAIAELDKLYTLNWNADETNWTSPVIEYNTVTAQWDHEVNFDNVTILAIKQK